MFTFLKNILNINKKKPDICNHKIEHEESTGQMKLEDKLHESITGEVIPTGIVQSDHLQIELDQYCNTEKSRHKIDTILKDCSNTVCKSQGRSTIQKSDAHLNSDKKTRRKSARVAAGRISRITRESRLYNRNTFKINRGHSQRPCAIKAEKKIAEIIDMSLGSDYDEDDYTMNY